MTIETLNPLLPYKASTFETIDFALYDWLNETMDLFCSTNEGWQKVSCIWVAGERSGQRSNQIRTRSGIVNYPVITIERTAVNKDLNKKGSYYGNIPPVKDYKGGSITIARTIQPNKTANFLNADSARQYGVGGVVKPTGGQINFPSKNKNKKIVYEQISVPMPVYVDITYAITIQTEYQQQMNELVQPFVTKTYGVNQFFAHRGEHRYECFIQQDFGQQNNVSDMGEDRRNFATTIQIQALGYLIGQGKNDPQPSKVIRQNAVELRTPRERTIFGDKPHYRPIEGQPGKYRP